MSFAAQFRVIRNKRDNIIVLIWNNVNYVPRMIFAKYEGSYEKGSAGESIKHFCMYFVHRRERRHKPISIGNDKERLHCYPDHYPLFNCARQSRVKRRHAAAAAASLDRRPSQIKESRYCFGIVFLTLPLRHALVTR